MDTEMEEEKERDGEEGPPPEGPEEEDGAEAFSFKYSPGKLRGNQYKKMMTKEELEEEQRVQKEQLEAIFKLMKDNKETFGEMSDGDVQEQLRLYDMDQDWSLEETVSESSSFCLLVRLPPLHTGEPLRPSPDPN
ncbi:matrix-remodeling-associated protein 7 [Pteropus alecto]|uniref:matrix-remodeling-associated protein 7 n=1 Tax=Pteropus alecto TaxID=9402 RepID=UPI0007688CFC|nr:matrix-remodeling-associated protein 7 [Pteropus alecto]